MLHNICLSDAEASGLWWRPDAPDDPLPGVLRTHESDEVKLTLMGEWRSADGSPVREAEVIQGQTDNIHRVTLVGCRDLHPAIIGGIRRLVCSVDTVLAGDDLGPTGDLTFSRIAVEYTHLAEWAYAYGVNAPLFADPTRYDDHQDSLPVTFPRIVKPRALLAGLTIAVEAGIATKHYPPLGLKAEPSLSIVITRQDRVPLDVWRQDTDAVQEFFSFVTGVPIRPKHTWASVQRAPAPHPAIVEVHTPVSQADPFWEGYRRSEMLVTYEETAADFQTYIERWMQRTPLLARACRQFLVARDGTAYAEQRFLSLARALEVLHASQEGRGCLMEASQFRLIKEALEEVVRGMTSGDTQEAITRRVGNLNQASYQNRVHDLLKSACQHLQLAPSGTLLLAKEIAGWRHGFTHLLEGKEIRDHATSERVFRLGQLMEVTFEACMLPLLGFSTATVHTIIQRKLQQQWPYVRELISRAGNGGTAA